MTTGDPPRPPAPPVSVAAVRDAVQKLANQTLAVAARRERQDLGDGIRAEAQHFRSGGATVVLAGEPNSGKSSLLNALVDWPNLSPVDVDVTTGVHIVVRYGPTPSAFVYLGDDPQGRPIQIDEIGAWATVAGNPRNERGVRAVEVALDRPLLRRGLILIDTPGVGGLDAAHTDVTLAAMRRADALLFVADAAAELAEPQLRFLATATERVDAVIVALTKVDAFRGWATVMERNRAIMSQRTPSLADASIIPVSSHYHIRAATLANAGNEGAAATIRGLGALPRLHAEISARIIDRLELVRLRNLVRVCAMTVERLRLPDVAQESDADPDLLEAMEAERTRMTALRQADASWPRDLADGFALLQLNVNTELNRRLTDLRRQYETVASDAPLAKVRDELGPDLDLALRAMWTDISVTFAEGVTSLLATTAASLDLDRAGLPSSRLDLPERAFDLPARRAGSGLPARQSDFLGEMRTIVFGALPGAGLASYAAQLATGVAGVLISGGLAAGLILGVVAVVGGRRRRAELHDRQAAMTLIRDTLENIRTEAPPVIQTELTAVRSASERAIREVLAARAAELAAALKGREAMLREDAAARKARRQAAAQRLAELPPIDQEIERLGSQLRRMTPRTPPVA